MQGWGLGLSGVLLAAYAQGPGLWPLGLLALVPWLQRLNHTARWCDALLQGWLMSMVLCVACLSWFGVAIGHYTQWGPPAGLLLLVLAAPLLQAQALAYALVRHLVRQRHGPLLAAWAASAALPITLAGCRKAPLLCACSRP
ncbi:MAG: hypothetical protein C4K60_04905 [Ideonella sp. MAG2]|nr:MAG: hypothetical protein C4K60_04905 [Ideonella sp. MAG2]